MYISVFSGIYLAPPADGELPGLPLDPGARRVAALKVGESVVLLLDDLPVDVEVAHHGTFHRTL